MTKRFLLALVVVAPNVAAAPWDGNGAAWCAEQTDTEPSPTRPVYKVVDAADLGIGSRKYADRDIEVRGMRCYFADLSDYRCMSGVNVAVFTKKIENEAMKRRIENECDQLRTAAVSPRCRFDLRFRFNTDDVEQDLISGYQRRTVISPDVIEVVSPSAGRSRKGR